jgi:hypothetical protein
MVFRLVRMNATCEKLAYYIHALAMHGGQYMQALKSLGKHMNEGVENHHKDSWVLMDHTFRGGAAGNPYAVKAEDGSFVKTEGAAYTHQTTTMSEALMVEQSRLMYFEFWKSWDVSMWEERGLKKPDEEDFNSVLFQAPQVMAQKAVHRRREAEVKYKVAVESNKEDTSWSWVKAEREHQVQKTQAVLEKAIQNEEFWLEKCKKWGQTKRLPSDAGKKGVHIRSFEDL